MLVVIKLFVIACLLLIHGLAEAQTTYTITSCAPATVQAAVNGSVDGDTVFINTPGPCTWSDASVVISGKGIKLHGPKSGTRLRIINNATAQQSGGVLRIVEDTTHSTEVSHITWQEASGNLGGNGYAINVFSSGSTGRPVLLHDHDCTPPNCTRFVRLFTNRGVIYRNSMVGTATQYLNRQFLSCKPAGSASWDMPATYGTADTSGLNHIYVENNYVSGVNETTDPDDSCRIVYRFNRFRHGKIGGHGQDTSPLGCRTREVYNNVFTFIPGVSHSFLGGPVIGWRGCSGVVVDNVIQQNTATFTMRAIIQTLRRNVTGTWRCWGSPANPIHGAAGTNDWAGNPGTKYPAPHQIGWGRNASGTADAVEGAWIWSNEDEIDDELLWNGDPGPVTGIQTYNQLDSTMGFEDFTPDQCGSDTDTTAAYFVHGRDFFLGDHPTLPFKSGKPGYTKCIDQPSLGCNYPHPCRHDVQGATCGGSGPVPDNQPPQISVNTPAPFFDTTSSTVDFSGTVTDDGAVVSVTWANATTGGSGAATLSSGTWTITGMPQNEAVNTVTITATDDQALQNSVVLKIRRQTCDSGLPFTNTFTSSETWPSPGACYQRWGSGLSNQIVSNRLQSFQTGTSGCDLYMGASQSPDQFYEFEVIAVGPSQQARAILRASGSPGQPISGYVVNVDQTGSGKHWIGRYNGVFGLDKFYRENLNLTITAGTVVRSSITGNTLTLETTGNPTITQDLDDSFANGRTGHCLIGAGTTIDNTVAGNAAVGGDTQNPDVTILAPVSAQTNSPEIAIGEFNGTVTDNVAVDRCEYQSDRNPGFLPLALVAGVWSNLEAVTLSDGENTLRVRCFDTSANFDQKTVVMHYGESLPLAAPRNVRGLFR